jgi:hypothetical protein
MLFLAFLTDGVFTVALTDGVECQRFLLHRVTAHVAASNVLSHS